MSVTAAVAATGDARIDGLLSDRKWSGSITYSDVDSPTDYQAGYESDESGNGISAQNEGFSQFNAQQMKALHSALTTTFYNQEVAAVGFSISAFTNLDITYAGAGEGNATIRAANSSDAATAFAYYPGNDIYGGDVFVGSAFDDTNFSLKTPVAGGYAWATMLHEIGHALGLKHGHELFGPGDVALPTEYDSLEYSLMTYRSYVGDDLSSDGYTFEQWGAPQTYMMLDIAALQTMYGADYTANSGDTTYSWAPNSGNTLINGQIAIAPGDNRIFATIWDGGGVDTYDLSAYQTALSIDLRPGGYSLFSQVQQADLGEGVHYARGNIFNALTFGGSNASLIENAIGGSGNDTIVGTDASNVLTGNGGNDKLNGGTGADTLIGGTDNDTYYVDIAGDTIVENAGGGPTDRVLARGTFTLVADDDIEVLATTLQAGTGAINLTGNDLAQTIFGNAGANVLSGLGGADVLNGLNGGDTLFGGAGTDTLTGGGGADHFQFGAAIGGNGDRITDFTAAVDMLVFTASEYGLAAGALAAESFTAGAAAFGGTAQFIYSSAAKTLHWDADGDGLGAAILVATFDTAVALTNADFVLV